MPSRPPRPPRGLPPLATPPDLGHWPPCCRTSLAPTSHTRCQRFIARAMCQRPRDRARLVLAPSPAGATGVQPRRPPQPAARLGAGGLASDWASGSVVGLGWLGPPTAETPGHRRLRLQDARGRGSGRPAGGGPRRRASEGEARHALAGAVVDRPRGGAQPEEAVGLWPARLDHGRRRAIPPRRQGQGPRPSGPGREAGARRLIRDGKRHPLALDPGQTEVPALLGARGARAWDGTAVDAQAPPGGWQRGARLGGEPRRQHRLPPGPTRSQALGPGGVRQRLIQAWKVGSGCPE